MLKYLAYTSLKSSTTVTTFIYMGVVRALTFFITCS